MKPSTYLHWKLHCFKGRIIRTKLYGRLWARIQNVVARNSGDIPVPRWFSRLWAWLETKIGQRGKTWILRLLSTVLQSSMRAYVLAYLLYQAAVVNRRT